MAAVTLVRNKKRHPTTGYLALAGGRRLIILDPDEVDDDLVRDVTEVLTSFCARLYGRRSARNRAGKALRCAARDTGLASPRVVP
jgi:predicted site-specific integrase-resolvase